MNLIFNVGSSSIKYKVFDGEKEVESGQVEQIGLKVKNHSIALKQLIEQEKIDLASFDKVGHRVVHGKDLFTQPTEITEEVINKLEKISDLAPLHNKPEIEVIKEVSKLTPKVKQVLVFDTAFFANLPKVSSVYPLPYSLYKEGIKKYGFHGLSHQYLMEEGIKQLKLGDKHKLITIHLGAGSSITAIKDGKPVDHSLGFTPLAGLAMQTRPGDLDPGIIIHLLKTKQYSLDELEQVLNNESGVKGLTNGKLSDMRDILFMAGEKVEDDNYEPTGFDDCTEEDVGLAKLALEIYVNRIRKYLGGYYALLGELDGIVFGGTIGNGSSVIREKITKDLPFIKEEKILVLKTDEEFQIAKVI